VWTDGDKVALNISSLIGDGDLVLAIVRS